MNRRRFFATAVSAVVTAAGISVGGSGGLHESATPQTETPELWPVFRRFPNDGSDAPAYYRVRMCELKKGDVFAFGADWRLWRATTDGWTLPNGIGSIDALEVAAATLPVVTRRAVRSQLTAGERSELGVA